MNALFFSPDLKDNSDIFWLNVEIASVLFSHICAFVHRQTFTKECQQECFSTFEIWSGNCGIICKVVMID